MAGQQAPLRLRRSALRAGFPAVLGREACGITRYVHFVHCAQTDAASQKGGALRALASDPALLGAKSLRPLPGHAFASSACHSTIRRRSTPI